jgi:tetratricopeptide (TPR) repeat protein
MEQYKEALIYLMEAIRLRPSSMRARISFIRGLFLAGFYDEAQTQVMVAMKEIGEKTVFRYYHVAILLALGKSKEALLELETALREAPQQVKKLIELQPSILQHSAVVDLIARYRRRK